MAKRAKKAPKAAKAAVQPSEVLSVISEKKLKALMSASRSASKDVASINGGIREKIGYAKEHDHLHTGVFSLIRRLDRMEPEKLADFLGTLEHYLDISGLQARADQVQTMAFGPGNADDAGEDDTNLHRGTFPRQAAVAAE